MSEYGFVPKDDPNKPAPVLRAGVESSLGEGDIMQHEPGTFASLWSNLRDVFFPVKLPPLVLESKPIPVIDRMATKQDPRATAGAFAIYAIVLLLFALGANKLHQMAVQKAMQVTQLTPPPIDPALNKMGGGGGQRGPAPVSKGRLPEFAKIQITPPAAPPLEEPKIRMPDPTIEVQKDLKMANNSMPNFGDPNSPLFGNSMGNGRGTGIGNGNGTGLGPGSGGGYGGGAKQIGGGVKGPVIIYQPEPEFSEEARKAKFQGVVTVSIVVDAQGRPQNVHVTRGVGMGLDEKAMEAVRQYRFKPGTENGKPVATYLNVEVNFEIF
ncbi:MAG: energy transducer TonB [Acidobacteriaceae bacterium]